MRPDRWWAVVFIVMFVFPGALRDRERGDACPPLGTELV